MKSFSALVCVATALLVSACGTETTRTSGVETVKKPIISVQRMAQPVRFNSVDGLDVDQVAAVDAFFQSIGVRYGDVVHVDDPQGNNSARQAAVAAILKRYGLSLAASGPAVSNGGGSHVVVSRATATPPACPDWSANPFADFNARAHSNFGCATQSNLAAMIADPRDLEQGKTYDGPDPAAITRGISDHQTMKPAGFRKLPTTATGSANSAQ